MPPADDREAGSFLGGRGRWPSRPVLALAFVAVSLALFANTLGFGYVLDDNSMVKDNPILREVDLGRIFGTSAEKDYTGGKNDNYRPLGVLSLAVNYRLDGLNPWGYRLVNLVLHGVAAFLLYDLLARVLGRKGLALLAAAVFLVHPIHTEVADQIKGRFELLAAVFGLVSLRIFAGRGGDAWRIPFGAACFLASLFSKEGTFGLIFVYPALDWIREGALGDLRAMARWIWRGKWRYLALSLCAAAAVAARYEVLGYLSQRHLTDLIDNPIVREPQPARFLTALKVLPRYVHRLVLPIPLSADYSYDQIQISRTLFEAGPLLGAVLLAAWIVATAWSGARNRPALFLALLFMGGTFAVQSNLFVPIGTIMAERLLYLPSAGFCLLFALALGAAVHSTARARARRAVAVILCLLVVGLMAWRTHDRNLDWENDHTLLESAYRVSPRSAKVLSGLGLALLEEGRYGESEAIYRRAVEIMPAWRCTRIGLGKALIRLDRDDEARTELARVDPLPQKDPEAHYLMGVIDLKHGAYEDAAREFDLSAYQWPDFPPAAYNLGYALYKLGRHGEAAERYVDAFRDFPADPRARRELPRLVESLDRVVASGGDRTEWAKGILAQIPPISPTVTSPPSAEATQPDGFDPPSPPG